MDNENQYIVGYHNCESHCGKKFHIFYNKSEEGKNIERREWKNFEFGEQLSA
jgi:hypothetical protein